MSETSTRLEGARASLGLALIARTPKTRDYALVEAMRDLRRAFDAMQRPHESELLEAARVLILNRLKAEREASWTNTNTG